MDIDYELKKTTYKTETNESLCFYVKNNNKIIYKLELPVDYMFEEDDYLTIDIIDNFSNTVKNTGKGNMFFTNSGNIGMCMFSVDKNILEINIGCGVGFADSYLYIELDSVKEKKILEFLETLKSCLEQYITTKMYWK